MWKTYAETKKKKKKSDKKIKKKTKEEKEQRYENLAPHPPPHAPTPRVSFIIQQPHSLDELVSVHLGRVRRLELEMFQDLRSFLGPVLYALESSGRKKKKINPVFT